MVVLLRYQGRKLELEPDCTKEEVQDVVCFLLLRNKSTLAAQRVVPRNNNCNNTTSKSTVEYDMRLVNEFLTSESEFQVKIYGCAP